MKNIQLTSLIYKKYLADISFSSAYHLKKSGGMDVSILNTKTLEELGDLEILEYERENIEKIIVKIKTEHDKESASVDILRKCNLLRLLISDEIEKRRNFVQDVSNIDFILDINELRSKRKIKDDSIVEIWEKSYLISLDVRNLVPNFNSLILEYRKRRNQSPD
jgi:ATP-dependent 26S proteasome regulatory subunit